MSIDHELRDLHRMDLNALVAFDALMSEGSVTRAAERAGVTQSAMSHTLAKLRQLLDDPLLVRVGTRMAPTPRAEALRGPIRGALLALRRALEPESTFDPSTSRRELRMAAPDLFALLVLPPLRERFVAEAPGIAVTVEEPVGSVAGKLETGALDLAIVPELAAVDVGERPAPDLRRRLLVREGFRVFVGRRGPLGDLGRLGPKAYREAPHLVVSPRGGGPGLVDHALAERGEARWVAMRVPHFAVALELVARGDLVLTAPASLAAVADARGDVRHHAVPVPLPDHGVAMVWHPRVDADPGHRWLRDRVAEAVPLRRGRGARRARSAGS